MFNISTIALRFPRTCQRRCTSYIQSFLSSRRAFQSQQLLWSSNTTNTRKSSSINSSNVKHNISSEFGKNGLVSRSLTPISNVPYGHLRINYTTNNNNISSVVKRWNCAQYSTQTKNKSGSPGSSVNLADLYSTIAQIRESLKFIGERLEQDNVAQKLAALTKTIQDNPNLWDDPPAAQKLLREQAALKSKLEMFEQASADLNFNIELFKMGQEEGDEQVIAEAYAALLSVAKNAKLRETETLMTGETDSKSCYLEIHAGAGGTESMDWAGMLLRMYTKWAESKGFSVTPLSETKGEVAGIKSACIQIDGNYAFGWLRTETGVHRLVRNSPFDAQGKRHTSFCSVTIFPVLDDEDINIEINPKDLRIDTFRASGAGGQHVNRTESAVRITHIPTGIVVTNQSGRSQHQNKDAAMKMLKSRLYQAELKRKAEKRAALDASLGEIAWGNQIRSYVLYPYKMVKDLRTGVESNDPTSILDGELDDFMKAALAKNISHASHDLINS